MPALTMELVRDEVTPALVKLERAPQLAAPALTRAGLLLQTRIQGRASGRPGPNVITGTYRRSFSTKAVGSGNSLIVVVGTNAPQALRLEYGFSGTDSRGRSYTQPAFPHVEPALVETQQEIIDMIADEILKGLK